jgi:hypothetical protein
MGWYWKSVSVGQTVKENDSLLILEAMKMEVFFLHVMELSNRYQLFWEML